ncbi:DUF4279 domain-containing protein [Actinoplanes sp. CA-142083]|uniref:DUF4279 domain-containing protein n=1 Tax=Actinoplanes sp. CA-142083 TaxID=3239903 RepID=UPI003D91110C
MSVPGECLQRAYLYLERNYDSEPPYSDDALDQMFFEPAEVTARVGLAPTTAWRRGDPAPRHDRPPRRFSSWSYELPESSTRDTEEVVTALLDAIEPHAAGIAVARAELGLRAGVMVVIWLAGGRDRGDEVSFTTPALSFRERTVQRLAAMGLSLDHDLYVEVPE